MVLKTDLDSIYLKKKQLGTITSNDISRVNIIIIPIYSDFLKDAHSPSGSAWTWQCLSFYLYQSNISSQNYKVSHQTIQVPFHWQLHLKKDHLPSAHCLWDYIVGCLECWTNRLSPMTRLFTRKGSLESWQPRRVGLSWQFPKDHMHLAAAEPAGKADELQGFGWDFWTTFNMSGNCAWPSPVRALAGEAAAF